MTYKQFNAFCRSLKSTTRVVQWGGAHVWKVGGKVFAVGGWEEEEGARFTFKVSDIAFEMLKDRPGLRPAPYLASRGLKWIQHFERPGLSDAALRDYIRHSHALVAGGLSRKLRIKLGLGRIVAAGGGLAASAAPAAARRRRAGRTGTGNR